MKERVAEIIADGVFEDWPSDLIAQAVLDALMEPTEEMRLAGGYTQKYGETEDDRYAYGIWQAMITAAKGG